LELKVNSKPVIVALDKPDISSAVELAKLLDPELCRVKVGKELFTSAGPGVVSALHDLGFEVFLDLKFHDIPNTVAGACRSAAGMGVWMLNVHASGGPAMLSAARDAIGEPSAGAPLLIGVTVLTSMDEAELAATGVTSSAEQQVDRLTGLVSQCGLDGVVCSAHEATNVKDNYPGLISVTPGIRMADDSADDQRRIMTPERAMQNGSTFLVIGRSVTGAANPAERLQSIQQSLAHV
jgi:orotidine-5'-phosphate decarboxylase